MKTSETKTTSLLGRNIFPTPTPIDTTVAEMLQLLKCGDAAIGYALEYLEPWELGMFFEDWWKKADMTGWLREWHQRHGTGEDEAEQQEAAAITGGEPDYSDMRAFNRTLAAARRERKAQPQ